MQQTHRMTDLFNDIRKTAIFRELIPQEAGIGWPIPLRKAGQVYVILLFFGMARLKSDNKTALYPPLATLTLNWTNWQPVEYLNLRFRHPWPETNSEQPVGTFPHEAIAHLSISQYREQRDKLLTMYDELLNALIQDTELSTEWETTFSLHLRLLMEPALEFYYRALGPKFFERFLPTAQ